MKFREWARPNFCVHPRDSWSDHIEQFSAGMNIYCHRCKQNFMYISYQDMIRYTGNIDYLVGERLKLRPRKRARTRKKIEHKVYA